MDWMHWESIRHHRVAHPQPHTQPHILEKKIATCYFKIYHGQPMHTVWRRFLERGSPRFFDKGKSPHLGRHFWKEDHALKKKIHRLPYEDTDNPLHKDDLALISFMGFIPSSPLKKLILWNPSTRQCNHIPCPSFVGYQKCMYSFFYDLDSDDYKIVRIFTFLGTDRTGIDIFTLKTNKWRTVEETYSSMNIVQWLLFRLEMRISEMELPSQRVVFGLRVLRRRLTTYPPPGSPIPTMGHDGQLYGLQHYRFYSLLPTSSSKWWALCSQPSHLCFLGNNTNNLVNDGNMNGNNGAKALRSSHQNSSLSSNGSYGRASLPTVFHLRVIGIQVQIFSECGFLITKSSCQQLSIWNESKFCPIPQLMHARRHLNKWVWLVVVDSKYKNKSRANSVLGYGNNLSGKIPDLIRN
ncbi:hypothetical protein AAG906_015167 [Vitis piasezkii]